MCVNVQSERQSRAVRDSARGPRQRHYDGTKPITSMSLHLSEVILENIQRDTRANIYLLNRSRIRH